MLALSVSISTGGSPRLTSPPSSTSHLSTVPSSIESDRRGIVTSLAIGSSPLDVAEGGYSGLHHVLLVRECGLLERLGIGHGNVGACHALHGGVEPVERLLLDQRGEVGAHAAVRPTLLDDHGAVGLLDGLEDGVEVERAQGAGIDPLRLDLVLLGELLGRLCGGDRPARDADDGHVVALAADGGLAEAHRAAVLGHLAALAVERLVLDEDDRVVVADGGLQQALGVRRRARHRYQETRHVQVERLEAVRMGGAELVARALRHADHDRHLDLAAEHVADRRRVVDDLVHREQREVDGHDLDHRPQADHGRADAHADDGVLGDRRVAHALLAEVLEEALRDLEGALEDPDVFAHDEDVLVGLHLLAKRLVERLAVAHRGHQSAPPSSSGSPEPGSLSPLSPVWGVSAEALAESPPLSPLWVASAEAVSESSSSFAPRRSRASRSPTPA